MADESLLKILVDLDAKEAIKRIVELNDQVKKVGEVEDLKALATTILKIGTVAGVAAAGILAVKTAIDMSVEAEHIKQINNSFEALAKSAGLSATVIKEELVGAAKGLADDTDILQAANKAIVSMGDNAKHIPETMELARKASVLFGGDLISNFESLNQALATGNTRAMRQFGIIINSEKAQKDYAKSIGTSVEFLSEAGKKQAIFNAALEQAKQKFSGVDETSLKTTNSLKRIGTSLQEIKEIAILAWDRLAGPYVSKAVGAVSDAVHNLAVRFKASFGEGKEAAAARLELTNKNINAQRELLQSQIKSNEAFIEQAGGKGVEMYKAKVKEWRQELALLDKQQEQMAASQKKRDEQAAKAAETPEAAAVPKIDYEQLKAARSKFEKELLALSQNRINEESKIAESIAEVDVNHYQKREEIYRQAEERLEQIKREFLDKGVITKEQYAQVEYQIEQAKNAQIHQLEQNLENDRIKALELATNNSRTAAEGIKNAFALAAANGKKDFLDYGKTGQLVFNSIKSNAIKAFQALGDGSKNAGEAMRGFMFGAIADIAEAKGQELLAWGLGTLDPKAIAGGGALIALSSLLRSQAGGASQGIGGGGGGGGGGAGPAPETAGPQAPAIQEQQKRTVSVNIAGSYYETEQTRTRLMEMIREAGDFTDFNLKQIGQA